MQNTIYISNTSFTVLSAEVASGYQFINPVNNSSQYYINSAQSMSFTQGSFVQSFTGDSFYNNRLNFKRTTVLSLSSLYSEFSTILYSLSGIEDYNNKITKIDFEPVEGVIKSAYYKSGNLVFDKSLPYHLASGDLNTNNPKNLIYSHNYDLEKFNNDVETFNTKFSAYRVDGLVDEYIVKINIAKDSIYNLSNKIRLLDTQVLPLSSHDHLIKLELEKPNFVNNIILRRNVTPTPTRSRTPTRTGNATPTRTQTPTITRTRSQTPTPTITRTQSPTRTRTKSQTQTPSRTGTQGATPTRTPTNTRTRSQTPTNTRTRSRTPTKEKKCITKEVDLYYNWENDAVLIEPKKVIIGLQVILDGNVLNFEEYAEQGFGKLSKTTINIPYDISLNTLRPFYRFSGEDPIITFYPINLNNDSCSQEPPSPQIPDGENDPGCDPNTGEIQVTQPDGSVLCQCPPGTYLINNFCQQCPPNTYWDGSNCRGCEGGQEFNPVTGLCECPEGLIWDGEKCTGGTSELCIPFPCDIGYEFNFELCKCVQKTCGKCEILVGDQCVPITCEEGFQLDPNTCQCLPIIPVEIPDDVDTYLFQFGAVNPFAPQKYIKCCYNQYGDTYVDYNNELFNNFGVPNEITLEGKLDGEPDKQIFKCVESPFHTIDVIVDYIVIESDNFSAEGLSNLIASVLPKNTNDLEIVTKQLSQVVRTYGSGLNKRVYVEGWDEDGNYVKQDVGRWLAEGVKRRDGITWPDMFKTNPAGGSPNHPDYYNFELDENGNIIPHIIRIGYSNVKTWVKKNAKAPLIFYRATFKNYNPNEKINDLWAYKILMQKDDVKISSQDICDFIRDINDGFINLEELYNDVLAADYGDLPEEIQYKNNVLQVISNLKEGKYPAVQFDDFGRWGVNKMIGPFNKNQERAGIAPGYPGLPYPFTYS